MKNIITHNKTTLYALVVTLLTGCSSSIIAPLSSPNNDFLVTVTKECGTLTLGGQTINSMFGMTSSEPLFINLTSDLAAGRISKSNYAATLNSGFPTGGNDAAINCVLDKLDNQGK